MKYLLKNIYKARYKKKDESEKEEIWKVLCQDFLQKFINKNSIVLDAAAGHCEFINNIKAGRKYACDIDDRISQYAAPDVKVVISDARKLHTKIRGKVDVVFMGCLLEHLPSKQAIIDLFKSLKKVLKEDGKLIILNPNIRFSTANYWDYFDHLIPVSDRSIIEVLEALNYRIELCIPGFVPNTIKDRLPKHPLLVKIYLHLPFLYPIFGRQMFIIARPDNGRRVI
jgi:SAM-dependent methyltransferase